MRCGVAPMGREASPPHVWMSEGLGRDFMKLPEARRNNGRIGRAESRDRGVPLVLACAESWRAFLALLT